MKPNISYVTLVLLAHLRSQACVQYKFAQMLAFSIRVPPSKRNPWLILSSETAFLSFSYDYTISLTTLFLPPQISKHNSSIWCFISTGLNPHLTPTNSKCLGQALNPSQVDRRFFFLYRYPPITSGKRPPSINSTATEFRPIPMFFAGAHRRPSGASNMRLMSAWMSTVGARIAQ